MKFITLISLVALCLLVTISAEKPNKKHAGKLVKSGDHELKASKVETNVADVSKAPVLATIKDEKTPTKANGNRKNKRHGKNKKGSNDKHQDRREDKEHNQQQNGRTRKTHGKPKANNGHHKGHKHERKYGRGKQDQ